MFFVCLWCLGAGKCNWCFMDFKYLLILGCCPCSKLDLPGTPRVARAVCTPHSSVTPYLFHKKLSYCFCAFFMLL